MPERGAGPHGGLAGGLRRWAVLGLDPAACRSSVAWAVSASFRGFECRLLRWLDFPCGVALGLSKLIRVR